MIKKKKKKKKKNSSAFRQSDNLIKCYSCTRSDDSNIKGLRPLKLFSLNLQNLFISLLFVHKNKRFTNKLHTLLFMLNDFKSDSSNKPNNKTGVFLRTQTQVNMEGWAAVPKLEELSCQKEVF